MSVPRWLKAIKDALAVPHARTQVNRGFIIPKSSPHLPLLVSSSDVRAPKVVQMLSNSAVELCWWMEGSQDQFRLLAKANIIPPPDSRLKTITSSLQGFSITALDEAGEESEDEGDRLGTDGKYDWEKKRREVFEGMKPAMRASWCAPVAPGSPISSYDEPSKWPREVPNLEDLKTDEDRKNYETALSNFAMVVFEPFKIDWVQLGEQPNRRTEFIRKGSADVVHWEEQIVAP